MRPKVARLIAVALGLLGCGPGPLRVAVELPDEATHLAVWVETPGGVVLASTGFLPRAGQTPVRTKIDPTELAGDDLRVRVFAGVLDGLGALDPDVPITRAEPADPVVPGLQGWSGPLVGDDAELTLEPDSPAVTARWLRRCPQLLPEGQTAPMSVTCYPGACQPIATQTGCTLSLDATDCVSGSVRAAVDGRGRVDFPTAFLGRRCEEVAPEDPALLSFACSADQQNATCRVDIFAPVGELALRTQTFAIRDVPAMIEEGNPRESTTYLTSLVALDDRVLVLAFADAARALDCGDATRMLLARIDLATEAVTSKPLDVACAQHAVADPWGPGFWAVFVAPGGRYHVGRFDADGTLTASVATVAGWPLDRVRGLATLDEPRRLGLSIDRGEADAEALLQVIALDPPFVGRVLPLEASEIFGLASGAGAWAINSDEDDRLIVVDDAIGQVTRVAEVNSFGSRGMELNQVIREPHTGFWVVGSSQRGGGVSVTTRRELVGIARVYDRPGNVYALGQWGPAPGLLLVGTTDFDPPRVARVRVLDVARARFLPGQKPIGLGTVHALALDARGDAWAMLGAVAEVVRIRAP